MSAQPKIATAMPATYDMDALYREHAQTVARWAARLGGPNIDAEEVVQDVFLTAHRLLPTFRGEAKFTTWLFRITQNQVRHKVRKLKWQRLLYGSSPETLEALATKDPSPVQDLERREAGDTIYRILDGMSEKYRTPFILFEIEKLSGEEIATMLDQKVATIWVWLHRARAQFLDGLKKLEEGSTP